MSIIILTPPAIAVRTEGREARKAHSTWPSTSQAVYYRNTWVMVIVSRAWYQAWAIQQREQN